MITLPAELTHSKATACLAGLLNRLGTMADQGVVVDAAALARFDSSSLAVLLELRRECLAVGKHFAVQGMPAGLQDLAVLYGLDALLPST